MVVRGTPSLSESTPFAKINMAWCELIHQMLQKSKKNCSRRVLNLHIMSQEENRTSDLSNSLDLNTGTSHLTIEQLGRLLNVLATLHERDHD